MKNPTGTILNRRQWSLFRFWIDVELDLILKIAVSLLPAVIMLLVFMVMDSYKLMDIKSVVAAIGIGSLAAVICYFVNDPIVENISLQLK